ncbi:hypothetical protein [Paenibacillus sp. QZ-Y1]|uniref:hypothetical protein n=1 Tax=Paenibacillus sp. QZ-Y1 TaxID=3414511 RepID=UPI003F79D983
MWFTKSFDLAKGITEAVDNHCATCENYLGVAFFLTHLKVSTARAIHLKTGLSTTLEFHIEQKISWWPNKHYWVDIVTSSGQMWELKARRDVPYGDTDGYYEDAEEQLTKYQSVNSKLSRGAQYESITTCIHRNLYSNLKKGEGSLSLKMSVSMFLIFLIVGCSMKNEPEFKSEAIYVVDVLEASIENRGFPKSEKPRIEGFFELDCTEEEEDIQNRLISIYMAFLGKTDFRNTDTEENKKLFKQLIYELEKIDEELETL